MRKVFIFTCLIFCLIPQTQAQTPRSEVRIVIDRLFEGMRKGDSTMVRSVFHPKVRMVTATTGRDGKLVLEEESSANGFVKAVGTPHTQIWDERIFDVEIWSSGDVATAWMRYQFYADTQFSHCGVDAMNFAKDQGSWKIIFLADTRQRQGCMDANNKPKPAPTLTMAQEGEIRTATSKMFEGFKKSDSSMVRTVLHPHLRTLSTGLGRDNKVTLTEGDAKNMLKMVKRYLPNSLNEQIYGGQVRIDGNLAVLVSPYTFHLSKTFSHCGTDIFHWVKTDQGWKSISMTWNTQKQNCPSTNELELGAIIDAWHRAAAVADETVFFGSLTRDAVYLGTDETERWTTPEFEAWGMKFFQRETAWDFHPKNRFITLSPDQKFAYWDELLDTWMGTCRGSGVAIKTPQGWKIKHYDLSMMIPNDKINAVMEAIK
jgi:hypothetical protein